MSITVLTKGNYENEVNASEKTVLIDFYATWCGPCRMISPIVEEISNENEDVKVCKVDVDKEPRLAQQFNVASIPTLVVIKKGKVTAQAVGYRAKDGILDMLQR